MSDVDTARREAEEARKWASYAGIVSVTEWDTFMRFLDAALAAQEALGRAEVIAEIRKSAKLHRELERQADTDGEQHIRHHHMGSADALEHLANTLRRRASAPPEGP